ncbi:Retrovirus-related Pol polyprotein from transposon RE1 [Vitis vinifera]|uniref:Retrovirus-related Pol polyprotein from transposon RE1 n=1 Tax=Vitis vinifera TaxID=29760 RepID=A0A438DDB4_VITVI|nr:Retrovirus-related Pol polyprotein from transposon RE1 [Vitis vinifera]
MSWLYASLSEDIMAQIVGYSTTVEIWNVLNQIYSTSSMAWVTELHTKLQTLKKDGLLVGEYIQRLKSICNSLAAIGELVSEKDQLIYLFNGLYCECYTSLYSGHHMLDTVTPFSGSEQVTVGNGKQLCISHLGTGKTTILVFSSCSTSDQVSKRVLLQGQLDNGLYKVQSSCSPSAVSFHPQVFIANIKDQNLWHKRLGHLALSIVNQILDSCNIVRTQKIGFNFCSSCQLAKSHRLPFSLSPSIAEKPFELIHTDLWGLSPIRSISGARYFLLFIDDHTRFTWFYLLKTKDEAYPTFLKFQALIENQFNTKIKVVQSDWGVEMGLSFLARSGMPLSYWPYAFQTATYLINRLSTPVLHHQSLTSHSITNSQLILILRSLECAFLGCSSHHKGSLTKPTSFLQAIKDPSWKQAMEFEFAAFNTTRPGIYLVVKPSTIRIVLSLTFSQNWCIRQLDVHNAFLHGDLAEDVFMEQPPGFVDPLYPTYVCKLDKSPYDLNSHLGLVNKVCQFMHHPSDVHWQAIKRILRYLKGTSHFGLFLQPSYDFNITCYTDADWASCPDDKCSTSGYCLFLASNLVSWSSSKQKVVSCSSAESEYRGVANGATEIAWTESLLRELSITPTRPPLILCDNISATCLAANPILHARTKTCGNRLSLCLGTCSSTLSLSPVYTFG